MDGISSTSTEQKVVATTAQHHVPNKDLTPSQKKAKRTLKKQLKLQQKRIKLETRLRHALSRKDPKVENETRKQLELLDQTGHDVSEAKPFHREQQSKAESTSLPNINNCVGKDEGISRRLVSNIYQQLQLQQQRILGSDEEKKLERHDQSISLLRHMTKGTQQQSMFSNPDALWGYTRQKFFERAMLVNSSFGKLHPSEQQKNENILLEERSKRKMAWNRLCSVRSICSIGCGPGNDAVGLVAFLATHCDEVSTTKFPYLDRALLMDWAMTEWNGIVNPLERILVPKYIQTMETCPADITHSLFESDENQEAQKMLLSGADKAIPLYNQESSIDLFLFSYILSEQRGLWHAFMKDLVRIAQHGALFYFSEPTPWQQHVLCKNFSELLDFLWLDSSMDFPLLQPLDNRVGPGVLLGVKR